MSNSIPLRTSCELRLLLPAAYQKTPESRATDDNLIVFPRCSSEPSEPCTIATDHSAQAPLPASVEERAAWKERALISQEYARILKRGGSLSM